MKKILLIVLFLPVFLFSQNKEIGLNLLQNKDYEDAVKANKFREFISNTYLERQTDSAYLLTNKLVFFTETHKLEKEKADALLLLADTNRNLNDNAGATKLLEQSLNIYKKLAYKRGVAKALNSLGVSYRRVYNLDEAKNYYQQSLGIAREIKDTILISKALLSLSNIYLFRQKSEEALKHLDESEYLAKSQNSERDLAAIYVNMASAYSINKDYNTAFDYINKTIQIGESLQNDYLLANAYQTMSQLYFKQQKYDDIITNASKQLYHAKKISDYKLMGGAYYFYTEAYKGKKNADSLLKYVELNRTTNSIIDNVKSTQALNKIKIDQEIAKDSLKNAEKLYRKEKAHQKEKTNLTLILGSILVVFLTTSILFYRKNKLSELEVLELQGLVDEFNNTNLIESVAVPANNIILKSNVVFNKNDILYMKSDGHYVEYNLMDKDKVEVERNSLTKALEKLPKHIFTRTHKSYVVNIEHIKIINSTQLMLDNGEWIPLSRTYKQDLKDLFHKKQAHFNF
jgi:tetratricopeptide (TPR) repeat protein